ncbi:AraC family transcriptional regulator [Streptomyces sp. NPDC000594]|uniref:AraC family transcriptional regulator n=1 Tax=Streptomyces sp. NPDC000594 TaxID=3154261 RepID=UPI00331C0F64
MSDIRTGPEKPAAEQDQGLLFRGSDIEELHDLISTRFAPNRMSVLAGGRLDGRFRCVREGTIALYELGYGAEVDIVPGAPLDFYNIHIPLAGDGMVTVDGKGLSHPLSIVGPHQRLSMRWNGESLNRVLIIPRQVVDGALTARLGDVPRHPLAFVPVLNGQAGPVRSWLNLVRHFAEFADSGLAERSPLATGHFERLLVDGLLDAQPHMLSDAVTGHDTAALPGALRRATLYCAEHAHEPISVTDMARAARVSVRSLREGFRKHLATTPLAYLRRTRLDLARRDLLAAADGQTSETVTDVALRWGFTHLGRFTGHYREAYGETPSQTLRRARRRSRASRAAAIRKRAPRGAESG